MKKWLLLPAVISSIAYAEQWQNTLFPHFEKQQKSVSQARADLEKGNYPLQFHFDKKCYQPEKNIKLNTALSLVPCKDKKVNLRIFRKGQYIATINMQEATPTLKVTVKPIEAPKKITKTCPVWNKKPITIDVSSTFKNGEKVRDFYSGQVTSVKEGKITMFPDPNANGLLLLEPANSMIKPTFDWHNAIVYFVLTDRFYNGNTANDHSYGRKNDGMQEIGTFHGGDLKGLTQKLDYLSELGINTIWISSPLEQIHGWVGGGSQGDFPHYGYHGYYHLDWTKIDANMGTEQELKAFVDQAHKKGIRVLFDIVMNHTGYATLADMQQFKFGKLYLDDQEAEKTLGKKWTDWTPKANENWHKFNEYIHFGNKDGWKNWWGKAWVRSDIGDYDGAKFNELQMSLASLPDLKTEAEQAVTLPAFFAKKETNAKNLDNAKVRDYLITWLSDWVRKYGIDGFRVDTAKHVEKSTWLALKNASSKALKEWQKNHKNFGNNFWMTGEAWGLGVMKNDYYQNGFDAMINFDFQNEAQKSLDCFANIGETYQLMSNKLTDFNVLSYLSSHDTELFFDKASKQDLNKQKIAGSLLMLSPGAVQIYYGDETARPFGATGSDPLQGTRSDMNWEDLTKPEHQALFNHWKKLTHFRKKHIAVGKGKNITLETQNYFAFSRQYDKDKVMVVWVGK
ncbi:MULTISPECIES: alpha-amylase [Pasteurellaceae]|uniref:Alpha-amylase n=1 Tax=Pasteurella atlantica TaxID=2827233 RepID=A0AAW8CL41_9PAST|nr:alpha-amylase [Pasteurella atlantica]MBR0573652.1 alpha-amylase [Pasteurella atlantica]MDP8039407.1 alpha-amylase [Pasteurella atlantica]MDP8041499.1 alpha-amylase [Pasteurella atlantica]MDP8043576.1 alpha-amylase [Pasteurella atlantica]MDP8045720.1 alpha-amylase [Pasteurella atlantica]